MCDFPKARHLCCLPLAVYVGVCMLSVPGRNKQPQVRASPAKLSLGCLAAQCEMLRHTKAGTVTTNESKLCRNKYLTLSRPENTLILKVSYFNIYKSRFAKTFTIFSTIANK